MYGEPWLKTLDATQQGQPNCAHNKIPIPSIPFPPFSPSPQTNPPQTTAKKNSLGKLQLNHLARGRALEQVPVVGRLLHHARVQRVARHPPLLEGAVAADEARQPRLRGRRSGGGVFAAAGELVQREGEGEGREGDVEPALFEGFSWGAWV